MEAFRRQPDFGSEYRCVVAAGGDGTLNRAINYRLPVPLAVLPLGNENLFARQFGFTTDPALLAGKIARGQTRTIDLGRAGQRLFGVVASAGFDGDVAHRLADWRQGGSHLKRVGSHSYLLPIATTMCFYPFPTVELDADGQRFEGALAMVFNVPRYALGLRLCPDALPDDGYLDWIVFGKPGRMRLAPLRGRCRARSASATWMMCDLGAHGIFNCGRPTLSRWNSTVRRPNSRPLTSPSNRKPCGLCADDPSDPILTGMPAMAGAAFARRSERFSAMC